jgi:adenylate cyclase
VTAQWSRSVVLVAIGVAALAAGVVAEAAVGGAVLDRATPRDTAPDPRVVVVVFGSGGGSSAIEVPHLRATSYRDIAVLSAQEGARAVAFVDLDSLTFSDGGLGRSNVIGSDELQRLGFGPLHDVSLVEAEGTIPFLAGYRVDPLASELAGLGVGSVGGSARTVPGAVRIGDLSDGLIVDSPKFAYDAVDRASARVVPGLALRLVEHATGETLTNPRHDSVRLGDREIPLEDGMLRVAWSDELDEIDDVRIVESADLFDDVPDDLFRDAIVLVGTTDPSRTEYVTTPVGEMPEVLVQANAVNTVLQAAWVAPGPPSAPWFASVAGVMAVSVAAGVRRPRRRWWPPVVVAIGGVCAWVVVSVVMARQGTLLSIVMPVAGIIAAAVLVGGLRQVEISTDRRRIRSLFAEYVPASVAEQLIASGRGEQASGGERVALTALFCDLRSFTPLAALLQPTQVRELLNVYYDMLAQVVFDDGGTVLQYTGDEIFAVFGAPLPDLDHPAKALACARRLFDRQDEMNDVLLARGLPPLNFGIGLHSGDAIAAHVGSSVRMQYAVIGDTINIASRHCSLAREGQIVLSDSTWALAGEAADAEPIEGTLLKGVSEPRPVYRIQYGPTAASGDPALLRSGPRPEESS